MQRSVLVTGKVGYFGIASVEELLRGGCEVSVLDAPLHGQAELAGDRQRSGVRALRAGEQFRRTYVHVRDPGGVEEVPPALYAGGSEDPLAAIHRNVA